MEENLHFCMSEQEECGEDVQYKYDTGVQITLHRLLNRTLNSTTRIHDMVMTIVAVAGSPDGRSLVLDFLINRLPDIVER